MTDQLTFFAARPADPNVEWMERTLDVVGEWMTARELATASGDRLNERDLRMLASASDNIISGQRGYRHIGRATAEEIHHAATWLESQASSMTERATRIRRQAHRIIG